MKVAIPQAWVDKVLEMEPVANLRTAEVPSCSKVGLGKKKVYVSHLFHGCCECRVVVAEIVAKPHAHLLLYVVLFGQQLAYALWVAIVFLQGLQLAAQWSEADIVRVIDIEVCNASCIWVEQGKHFAEIG